MVQIVPVTEEHLDVGNQSMFRTDVGRIHFDCAVAEVCQVFLGEQISLMHQTQGDELNF